MYYYYQLRAGRSLLPRRPLEGAHRLTQIRATYKLLTLLSLNHINLFTLLELCVSSLRRGHADLLRIVPILTDDPRRESKYKPHIMRHCNISHECLTLILSLLLNGCQHDHTVSLRCMVSHGLNCVNMRAQTTDRKL